MGAVTPQALVPLYSGKNLIRSPDTQTIIESVHQASGISSGKCIDYVFGIYNQLEKLGINDPAVTEMRDLLCKVRPDL